MGTVFCITLTGTLTTLHSFAGTGDGIRPTAALTVGNDGNLYGTTTYGSEVTGTGLSGNGTVFSITPLAATPSVLTTLHTFADDASEGRLPSASLLLASDGNLYGTTAYGGTGGYGGTLFSVGATGTFTTLYTFAGDAGLQPMAPLIQGTDGNLYGHDEPRRHGQRGHGLQGHRECYRNAHAHAHAHGNPDANANADAHADTHADPYTNPNAHTHADARRTADRDDRGRRQWGRARRRRVREGVRATHRQHEHRVDAVL